jgi:hypothetical protein
MLSPPRSLDSAGAATVRFGEPPALVRSVYVLAFAFWTSSGLSHPVWNLPGVITGSAFESACSGHLINTAFYSNRLAVHNCVRDLPSRRTNHSVERRLRNVHHFPSCFLFQSIEVFQPHGLEFINTQDGFVKFDHRDSCRLEEGDTRWETHSPAKLGSRHEIFLVKPVPHRRQFLPSLELNWRLSQAPIFFFPYLPNIIITNIYSKCKCHSLNPRTDEMRTRDLKQDR